MAATRRTQEPGATFGSRWTDAEREALQRLLDEHGRRDAARLFVKAPLHRTIDAARYQIDRNLSRQVE